MTGSESYVLDDICYLDLKTWTWSRSWRFVPRYDHTTWVWGGRIWVFGGLGEEMEKTNELWWLDLRGSPAFDAAPEFGNNERRLVSARFPSNNYTGSNPSVTGSTGYAANSSSVTANALVARQSPVAPGSISSVKFISSPNLPTQNLGAHFHAYTSGCLLDFVTPASVISSFETCLSALDLDTLRWRKLAEGKDLFNPTYRWHYCAMNDDGTQAWLLGCPTENGTGSGEEYLSDVLPIDLRKLGLLGNSLAEARKEQMNVPASDAVPSSHLSGIGADLARTFDQPPESGSGTDFIVTGELDDDDISSKGSAVAADGPPPTSKPIHVHRLILQARWPHFSRLYAAQMLEFHTKKMHIPEPYSAVRAFLYYLYTDSIAPHPQYGPTLSDVAGILVMANMYDMPRLRLLCVNRLGKELDVEHAAIIWERAGIASEEWLRRSAAHFIMRHWGRVVRTHGFKTLPQQSLVELCEEVDAEGRVVGGEELEMVGGLGGGKFGVGGLGVQRKRKSSLGIGLGEEEAETEDQEEGMDVS
jgi:BTB/POZ domain/Galactose oxidase, central domain